ncbi:MAG: N-acetyl sugar amidotransferase, partial [Bacteroidia bacterium]|nr:N-acetyl sugar amidotransferase [Bacteroidia bacterium]
GRDSTYLLYLAIKKWNLRPLAVHFNDGFDNPVAGENMLKAARILGVDLRTITSDFRECKDLKLVDLKASTPLLNNGTDIGIGASLYGVACKEGVKTILYGQSFRTEGIRPLAWAYFDGDFVRALHKRFGKYPLQKWKPENPGYNLGVKEMAYYSLKGIKTFAPFYYYPYLRSEADALLSKELEWKYPGAHYYDDLYWSLITYVHRVKFNIDFRKIAYSALIRSGQMERTYALESIQKPYVMEDEKVISLCIKRLGISREEFDSYLKLPPRNFWDYPNSFALLQMLKYPIWLMTRLGFATKVVYEKYFVLPFR